jgi:hypothetical protein
MDKFCAGLGIELDPIEAAAGFDQIKLLDDAVEVLIVNDDTKKQYLNQAGTVWRLYKDILPDSEAKAFAPRCHLFEVLAKKVVTLLRPPPVRPGAPGLGGRTPRPFGLPPPQAHAGRACHPVSDPTRAARSAGSAHPAAA